MPKQDFRNAPTNEKNLRALPNYPSGALVRLFIHANFFTIKSPGRIAGKTYTIELIEDLLTRRAVTMALKHKTAAYLNFQITPPAVTGD